MRRIFRRRRRGRNAGAKTGFGNEGGERGGIGLAGIVSNLRFLAGEIDAGGSDKRLFVQDFFETAGAGLAGHAVNVVADFLLHGFLTGRVSCIGADRARCHGGIWGMVGRFQGQERIRADVPPRRSAAVFAEQAVKVADAQVEQAHSEESNKEGKEAARVEGGAMCRGVGAGQGQPDEPGGQQQVEPEQQGDAAWARRCRRLRRKRRQRLPAGNSGNDGGDFLAGLFGLLQAGDVQAVGVVKAVGEIEQVVFLALDADFPPFDTQDVRPTQAECRNATRAVDMQTVAIDGRLSPDGGGAAVATVVVDKHAQDAKDAEGDGGEGERMEDAQEKRRAVRPGAQAGTEEGGQEKQHPQQQGQHVVIAGMALVEMLVRLLVPDMGEAGRRGGQDGRQDAAQAVLRGGGDVAVGIAFAFEAAVAVVKRRADAWGDAQSLQDAVGGDAFDVLPAPLLLDAAVAGVDGQPLRVADEAGGEIGGAAGGIVAAQNADGDDQP